MLPAEVGGDSSGDVPFVGLRFGERRLSEVTEALREKNCWCKVHSQTVSRTGLPIAPCSPFSHRTSPIVEKRSVTALLGEGPLKTPYSSGGRPVSRRLCPRTTAECLLGNTLHESCHWIAILLPPSISPPRSSGTVRRTTTRGPDNERYPERQRATRRFATNRVARTGGESARG